MHEPPLRVMFLYWGRRGALSRFTLEVGRAALADPRLAATISTSRQNENFETYKEFGDALVPIDTFQHSFGAATMAWRLPQISRDLTERIQRDQTQAVIELMPHIWSPLIAPAIKRAGARYITIMHDGVQHPGDPTSWIKVWTDRTLSQADLVLTLSAFAAGQIAAAGKAPRSKIVSLFHPDLTYGVPKPPSAPSPDRPFRLLFLGRILPYKGLPLFLDSLDLLRQEGVSVDVGVFGEGDLGKCAARLSAMNAEVLNRWLSEPEIGAILSRFDAVVLSHTEASQSGVAASAFGAGLPVITTPLGGLVEQVIEGKTGIVARRADPYALAFAIKRLVLDPQLYLALTSQIKETRPQRSMAQFVREVSGHARWITEETHEAL